MASKVRPDKHGAANYPTQDTHTPQNEADYVTGWNSQKALWDKGQGLSGMESYAEELDQERKRESENGNDPKPES